VSFCFFFQAEDGIRDFHVTGVQTCALPISMNKKRRSHAAANRLMHLRCLDRPRASILIGPCRITEMRDKATEKRSAIWCAALTRSEERRVGKECRSRWSAGW